MRRVHTPCLEGLETRKLLSHIHPAAAHAARARVAAHVAPAGATPLVLDGVLNVDNAKSGTTTTYNIDGSTTTSVQVMGALGPLGRVQGTWTQSSDSNGAGMGPDVLRLRGAGGSLLVVLNDTNTARPIRAGHGAAFTEYSQILVNATGSYAGASERGSVELFAARAGGPVTSLILHTRAR